MTCHVTTINFKHINLEHVFQDMKNLVTQIIHEVASCKVAISLAPLQRTQGNINNKIKIVNACACVCVRACVCVCMCVRVPAVMYMYVSVT